MQNFWVSAAAAAKSLQSCLTLRPHRPQPSRLPCSWDSPGKNTGVGCHFLLQCVKVKSESEVAQSCPTLNDLMDCSLPSSSAHGIFQARVLEWGAIAFSIWVSRDGLTESLVGIFLMKSSSLAWSCCQQLPSWTQGQKSRDFHILFPDLPQPHFVSCLYVAFLFNQGPKKCSLTVCLDPWEKTCVVSMFASVHTCKHKS